MKILIIDDSMTTRSIIKRMVTEYGFETFEAGNGSEALDRLKEIDRCDVAVIDWNMPIMNGLEFIKAVRSNSSYDHMSLIMITTEVEISQVSDALSAGANEYIMKPFTKDIIVEKFKLLGLVNE